MKWNLLTINYYIIYSLIKIFSSILSFLNMAISTSNRIIFFTLWVISRNYSTIFKFYSFLTFILWIIIAFTMIFIWIILGWTYTIFRFIILWLFITLSILILRFFIALDILILWTISLILISFSIRTNLFITIGIISCLDVYKRQFL